MGYLINLGIKFGEKFWIQLELEQNFFFGPNKYYKFRCLVIVISK